MLSLFSLSIAPSGPPMDVKVSIYSSSNILVSWKPPVGGADGYVILYSASNVTHLIEQRTLTMSLLNFLNESHLYTIRVFAYKDLPSLPYDAGNIYFAGTCIILYILIVPQYPHYQFFF